MANFPRTIIPQQVTMPVMPGPLVAVGQSGRTQLRATTQVGRVWTETFGPLKASDVNAQALIATAMSFWRSGTIFQIDHRLQRAALSGGNPSTTPSVVGGNQTGSSIVTGGWFANTLSLRAGDVILLPGLRVVYDVTADFTTNGAGAGAISINPPLFAGSSPVDTGAIITNRTAGSVTYRARVAAVNAPTAAPNTFYMGFSITFQECP